MSLCRIYGTVTFDVEILSDSYDGHTDGEVLDAIKSEIEGTDPAVLLKFFSKSDCDLELSEVNLSEVEYLEEE